MYQPKTIYTKVALETIINFLNGNAPELSKEKLPKELSETRNGCFVSLHKTDGSLRGCIGTIEPVEENLFSEINRNAVAAAMRDSRFSPLTMEEMDDVEISVDVLTVPEEIFDLDDLDPQIYGVIVSDGASKRAVLLPSIPGIDTVEKQLDIVKRKAGLDHVQNKKLKLLRFTSNRYH
ncbi:MAG: AmmeMemoRadiSam system protein A [Bacteroidales bacterium]|nr:AmmeMemoRadiSam system protein A [Bacteroidales bacterium]